MPLDPQVAAFYENKKRQQENVPPCANPGQSQGFSVDAMRKEADAAFNDKEEIFPIYFWEDRLAALSPEEKEAAGPFFCGGEPFGPPVGVRIYRPGNRQDYPILLYFHGGGFIMHNIASHDALCRKLSAVCDCAVVSVQYRLAPEHPYPACIQDAWTVLNWAFYRGACLGGDPQKIFVAGDSAGATISAALCLLSRNKKGPSIRLQMLFYGSFGCIENEASPSVAAFGTGEYVLPRPMLDFCMKQYVPRDADPSDPYLNPGKAASLSELPPAICVTAQYDPLRDDGEAFFRCLSEAGTPASLIPMEGMMHGFLLYWHKFSRAEAFLEALGAWVKAFFQEKADLPLFSL